MIEFYDSPMIRSVVFHPRTATKSVFRSCFDSEYVVPTSPSARIGYRVYPLPGRRRGPVVLHWHGNAELATDMDAGVALFHNAGWAVIAIDFRGYGWSSGQPSLRLLCPDAAAILPHLPSILEAAGIDKEVPCVAYGRSIGSVCAIEAVASSGGRFAGLILEGGIASLLELPMAQGLADMLGAEGKKLLRSLPDLFDQCGKLSRAPPQRVLVVHGRHDNISPVSQGTALHAACADKGQLVLIEAGHNDVTLKAEYVEAIRSFLATVKSEHFSQSEEDGTQGFSWLHSVGDLFRRTKAQVLGCFGTT
eukprot:CAMPEP_0119340410 /NCGR_PEP_ID=MMETSP1333-20130426/100338_1 /TAXON_ID=418940 /ORGANISM="Scyphosphaera apsteinii, Strain RCC1455" /LENGTH=305 /DNA_ID=CAMNT_0007352163 /DNA_START=38 /DNA_END=955 /DNA_ORIENTATION=+